MEAFKKDLDWTDMELNADPEKQYMCSGMWGREDTCMYITTSQEMFEGTLADY